MREPARERKIDKRKIDKRKIDKRKIDKRKIDKRTLRALVLAIDAMHAAIGDERRDLGRCGASQAAGRWIRRARPASCRCTRRPSRTTPWG